MRQTKRITLSLVVSTFKKKKVNITKTASIQMHFQQSKYEQMKANSSVTNADLCNYL
jgi:hypothetical protein